MGLSVTRVLTRIKISNKNGFHAVHLPQVITPKLHIIPPKNTNLDDKIALIVNLL